MLLRIIIKGKMIITYVVVYLCLQCYKSAEQVIEVNLLIITIDLTGKMIMMKIIISSQVGDLLNNNRTIRFSLVAVRGS